MNPTFDNLPTMPLQIGDKTYTVNITWQREPEQDLWEPHMTNIGNILIRYMIDYHSKMSEQFKRWLEDHASFCFSTFTRVWDAEAVTEIPIYLKELYTTEDNEVIAGFRLYEQDINREVDTLLKIVSKYKKDHYG